MQYLGKKDELEWRALGIKKKHPKVVRVQNYDIKWKMNFPEPCREFDSIQEHKLFCDGSPEDAIRKLLGCAFLRHQIEIFNENHDAKMSLEDVQILEIKKNEFFEL